MSGAVPVLPRIKFTDTNGVPLAGGSVTVFQAGTTTPVTTYQDRALTIPNTNPIVLDANGECLLWVDGITNYKVLLKNAAGATIAGWPVDNVQPSGLGSFLQIGTGAVQRDAQSKMRDVVNIFDYIPESERAAIIARTSTYDCHAAIMAAIESTYSGSTFYFSGAEVFFPPGRYTVGSTLNIKRQCVLRGTSAGLPFDGAAELSFPKGVPGIIINSFNTDGVTSIPPAAFPNPTVAATSTIIEGLRLLADLNGLVDIPGFGLFPVGHPALAGAGGVGNTAAHGIRMRGASLIRNCFIFGFEGDGIHIFANGVGSGEFLGSDNLFRLEGICLQRNAGHGVFVDGPDTNASSGYNINVTQNGGVGIYDSSFLGNTWVACHANSNSLEQYKTDSTTASSVFLNCYSEAGGLPSSFAGATVVVNGLHGAGMNTTARFIQPFTDARGMYMQPTMSSDTLTLGSQIADKTVGTSLTIYDTTGLANNAWNLNRENGRLRWQRGSVGEYISFYDSNASVANGFARNNSDAPSSGVGQIGISTHFFGTKTQMRFRGLGNAAPTTGEYISGDILWGLTMTAGGKAGWVCTTSGTAGSTAVFKQFGAIDP